MGLDPFQDLRPLAGTYATALAGEAFSRGLATTAPDGTRKPIPPGATPVVLPGRVIAERHQLAHTLAGAGFRMAQAIVLGPSRELLLRALSPLERRLIERSAPRSRALAIARIDFLVSSRPAALEHRYAVHLDGHQEVRGTTPAGPGRRRHRRR